MIEVWSFVSCPIRNLRQQASPLSFPYFSFCLVCVVLSFSPPVVVGQTEDIVVVQRAAGDPISKRRGTILEWKGNSLMLATQQRERQIANDEIIEIQTQWPVSYQAALESIRAGKHLQAGTQLMLSLIHI